LTTHLLSYPTCFLSLISCPSDTIRCHSIIPNRIAQCANGTYGDIHTVARLQGKIAGRHQGGAGHQETPLCETTFAVKVTHKFLQRAFDTAYFHGIAKHDMSVA